MLIEQLDVRPRAWHIAERGVLVGSDQELNKPFASSSVVNPDVTRREAWKSLASLTASILTPGIAGCASANQTAPAPHSQPPLAATPHSQPPATPASTPSTPARDKFGELLPLRTLGPRGPAVTLLGVGGAHVSDVPESMAEQIIDAAIENGIRFFDTAAMYGDGESEKRYGRFLVPKYRDVAFIMTKAHARSGEGVRAMLEASLRSLKTDYLDLWQMHDLTSEEDVDNRVRDGVVDVFVKAMEEGKVRHIGFSGHTTYKAHLRMLQVLKERGVQPTTAQMPVNVVDSHYESFILNVVPKCVENNVGVLAMKTLAYGRLLGKAVGWARTDAQVHKVVPEALPLADALGFVWSLPTSVLISGMQSPEEVVQNAAIARNTGSWTDAERQRRVEAVKSVSGPGVEFYKA